MKKYYSPGGENEETAGTSAGQGTETASSEQPAAEQPAAEEGSDKEEDDNA